MTICMYHDNQVLHQVCHKAVDDKKKSIDRDPDTADMFTPIKMTDKQRFSFAGKLSKLPELADYATASMSYKEFAEQIANELLDPKKQTFYKPYLEKVGFKND